MTGRAPFSHVMGGLRDQPVGIVHAPIDHLLRLVQGLENRQRFRPLGRGEVAVARTHRQAVGLPHRRRDHDVDAEVEIVDHLLDHRPLLGVLLAKHREVGPDDIEQLATMVVTPRKWDGREMPQRVLEIDSSVT